MRWQRRWQVPWTISWCHRTDRWTDLWETTIHERQGEKIHYEIIWKPHGLFLSLSLFLLFPSLKLAALARAWCAQIVQLKTRRRRSITFSHPISRPGELATCQRLHCFLLPPATLPTVCLCNSSRGQSAATAADAAGPDEVYKRRLQSKVLAKLVCSCSMNGGGAGWVAEEEEGYPTRLSNVV